MFGLSTLYFRYCWSKFEASGKINELDFHWLRLHFRKISQSQLIRRRSAISKALWAGVFFFFFPPLPLAYPSSVSFFVAFTIASAINVPPGRALGSKLQIFHDSIVSQFPVETST